MRISTLLAPCALAAALTVGGCMGSGTSAGYVSATYRSPAYGPDLVYLGNGVYVVEAQQYPTFYVNGIYWLYDDGYWFRSHYYTGDWVRARRPAPVLSRYVQQPQRYIRYRADDRHTRYRPPRRNEDIQVRDHRTDRRYDRRRDDRPYNRRYE